MIARIELENFMSHGHTVIEPARGLTVLVGPNNCGKSAVIAALQILSHNENSTYVLRHETRKCQVRVTTDQGDTILWRRGKSGGPAYEINGTTYDRLKSAGQPEELDRVLRLPKVACDRDEVDIHFGEQKSPVFLIRDSARTAADFFASSSDAGRMMKMQSLHKQKVRDAKREQKTRCQERDEWRRQVELLEPVPEIEQTFEQVCQWGSEIERLQGAMADLQEQITTGRHIAREHEVLELKRECLGELAPLPAWQPADELQRLLEDCRRAERVAGRLQQEQECLLSLESPPSFHACADVADMIRQLGKTETELQSQHQAGSLLQSIEPPPAWIPSDRLQVCLAGIRKQQGELEKLDQARRETERQWAKVKSEIEQWVAQNPSCPACGQALDAQDWMAHRQHLKTGVADG
ncbi:MAG: AAA family ATPase [Mariniblastus sp.]|nr:AAA family ATPase [Mariniblastus sp.]